MPGSYGHLFSRFFDFILSKPLSPDQVSEVEQLLTGKEALVFFEQDRRDQAHGYASAVSVRDNGHGRDIIVAALLHDVGKRRARLGALGRSLASIMIKTRLPLTRRMRAYRDHGEAGAVELASIGSADVVIEFARSHHAERPRGFDESVWSALQRADQPAKTFIPSARR